VAAAALGGRRWTEPWKDLASKRGVPGGAEKPPLLISATERARRTVVAADTTDGGTEAGPSDKADMGAAAAAGCPA